MASQPLLELEVGEGNPSIAQLSSRCLHNLVGVLLNCVEGDLYRQKLVIWDWRLGIMRTVSYFSLVFSCAKGAFIVFGLFQGRKNY